MGYFQHSVKTRSNPLIHKLIATGGIESYGLWWAIVEQLYGMDGHSRKIQVTDTWLRRTAKTFQLNIIELLSQLNSFANIGLIDSVLWNDRIIYAPNLGAFAKEPDGSKPQGHLIHRLEVFARDNFQCIYCGSQKDLTLDHVFPKSRGGIDEPSNLVCCCKSCNSTKRDRTPEEWLGGRS